MSTPATSPLESTTSNCMSVEGRRGLRYMRTPRGRGVSCLCKQAAELLNLLTYLLRLVRSESVYVPLLPPPLRAKPRSAPPVSPRAKPRSPSEWLRAAQPRWKSTMRLMRCRTSRRPGTRRSHRFLGWKSALAPRRSLSLCPLCTHLGADSPPGQVPSQGHGRPRLARGHHLDYHSPDRRRKAASLAPVRAAGNWQDLHDSRLRTHAVWQALQLHGPRTERVGRPRNRR